MKRTCVRLLLASLLTTGSHIPNFAGSQDFGPRLSSKTFPTPLFCRLADEDFQLTNAKKVESAVLAIQSGEELVATECSDRVASPIVGTPPAPEVSPIVRATPSTIESTDGQTESGTANIADNASLSSDFNSPLDVRDEEYSPYDRIPTLFADGNHYPYRRWNYVESIEVHSDRYSSEWRCTPTFSDRQVESDRLEDSPRKLRSVPADLDQEMLQRWQKVWDEIVDSGDRLLQTLECYPLPFIIGNQIAHGSHHLSAKAIGNVRDGLTQIDISPNTVFVSHRPLNVYTYGNGVALITPTEFSFDESFTSDNDEPQACFPIAEINEAWARSLSRSQASVPQAEASDLDGSDRSNAITFRLVHQLAKSLHRTSDWLKDWANRLDRVSNEYVANRNANRR